MSQADRGILWYALLGVLWPLLTSTAVLVAAQVLGRADSAWRRAAPALAVGGGFAAGYLAIQGLPPFTFELKIREALFYAALILALFGAYEARAQRAKPIARALLAVLLPLVLLEFQRRQHWETTAAVLWTTGLAGLVFASWELLGAREGSDPAASRTLGLALAGALAAGSYQFSGSVQIAQLGGALAVSVGLCALFALLRGAPGLGPAGVGAYVGLHHGVLWCAKFISDLSWTSFALLACVPLVAGLPRPRSSFGQALVRLAPLLLAGAALVLEYRDRPAPYGS